MCRLSLAVVALVAMAASGAYAQKPEVTTMCEVNTSWKVECNDCVCGTDGKPVCTQRECGVTPPDGSDLEALPSTCQEGQTWKMDCNSCFCANGRGACTLKGCLPPPFGPPPCNPGHSWKEGCNYCKCLADATTVCTHMKCPDGPAAVVPIRTERAAEPAALPAAGDAPAGRPDNLSPGDRCDVDRQWQEDCNSCFCQAGSMPACTLKICPTVSHPDPVD